MKLPGIVAEAGEVEGKDRLWLVMKNEVGRVWLSIWFAGDRVAKVDRRKSQINPKCGKSFPQNTCTTMARTKGFALLLLGGFFFHLPALALSQQQMNARNAVGVIIKAYYNHGGAVKETRAITYNPEDWPADALQLVRIGDMKLPILEQPGLDNRVLHITAIALPREVMKLVRKAQVVSLVNPLGGGTSSGGTWYQVQMLDGRQGWIWGISDDNTVFAQVFTGPRAAREMERMRNLSSLITLAILIGIPLCIFLFRRRRRRPVTSRYVSASSGYSSGGGYGSDVSSPQQQETSSSSGGLWDTRTYDQARHEQEYGRGVRDAEKADLFDQVFHGLGDIIGTVVPGETTEHKSYEKGYHDKQEGRIKKK